MTDQTAKPAAPVRIRCTSDRKPWTDTRPLEKGEVVEVPADVAAILIKGKFAEKVAADTPLGVPAADEEA
ncbi:hypothetical protein [Azospirillum soli]|uniref:hypothetical protein n=1 Tax=Azospirillum soli TaxID=1304799 RepID=UPI001AE14C72|nr:hypothetical protein [Azospirillum soli]MBP2311888.1 hypothetical protein [Azospirillum soli]